MRCLVQANVLTGKCYGLGIVSPGNAGHGQPRVQFVTTLRQLAQVAVVRPSTIMYRGVASWQNQSHVYVQRTYLSNGNIR